MLREAWIQLHMVTQYMQVWSQGYTCVCTCVFLYKEPGKKYNTCPSSLPTPTQSSQPQRRLLEQCFSLPQGPTQAPTEVQTPARSHIHPTNDSWVPGLSRGDERGTALVHITGAGKETLWKVRRSSVLVCCGCSLIFIFIFFYYLPSSHPPS